LGIRIPTVGVLWFELATDRLILSDAQWAKTERLWLHQH